MSGDARASSENKAPPVCVSTLNSAINGKRFPKDRFGMRRTNSNIIQVGRLLCWPVPLLCPSRRQMRLWRIDAYEFLPMNPHCWQQIMVGFTDHRRCWKCYQSTRRHSSHRRKRFWFTLSSCSAGIFAVSLRIAVFFCLLASNSFITRRFRRHFVADPYILCRTYIHTYIYSHCFQWYSHLVHSSLVTKYWRFWPFVINLSSWGYTIAQWSSNWGKWRHRREYAKTS